MENFEVNREGISPEATLELQARVWRLSNDWFADPSSRIEPKDYRVENLEILESKRQNKFRKNWFQAVISLTSLVADYIPDKEEALSIEEEAKRLSLAIQGLHVISTEEIDMGDALLRRLEHLLNGLS